MVEIEWAVPPAAPKGYNSVVAERNDSIVVQLKANPDKWARVASGVKDSQVSGFRKRGCKAVVRSVGGGLFDIYACWPTPERI